jgi:hypothetical protein
MLLKIKATLGKCLHWSNERHSGNLKIKSDLTMGHLVFQLRLAMSGLDGCDALFVFVNNQHLCCNSDALISVFEKHAVNGVLPITVVKENTFGAMESRFVSAEILEISANAFKLSVHYSYYNLYAFTNVFVYKTQSDCIHRLVLERCNQNLTIKKATGDEVKIDPGPG